LQLENEIKFEHISISDGLSQSVVNCILQDWQGFMWFGTQDGLNRYDGYKFTVYKNERGNKNSLSNNYIYCIYEDRLGNIWVGTTNGGLNKYDREKDSFINYMHNSNNNSSLSHNRIRAICEDHLGNLWIGTSFGGLNKFIKDENRFIRYKKDPDDSSGIGSNSIHFIYEDKKNNLWIGTWGDGLKRFDFEKDIFVSYKNDSDNIEAKKISSIVEDFSGDLWLATNDGLQMLDSKTEKFLCYKHDDANSKSISDNYTSQIFTDSSGILWVGTRDGGLNKFDISTHQFISYKHDKSNEWSISSNTIMSVYEDNSNIMWIGTFGEGISMFRKQQKKIHHYYSKPGDKNSLCSNKIYSFCEDRNGNLWIGTADSGLNKFDLKKSKFTHYQKDPLNVNSLSSNIVTSILEDREGNFWIGTSGGGLNKFNVHEEKFYRYRSEADNENSLSFDTVFCLAEDKNGIIWIGTAGGGLNKFDPMSEKFTHYKPDQENPSTLGAQRVRTLFIDLAGDLWIGLDLGGLNKFNRADETFTNYRNNPLDENSLSDNDVLTIFEDSSERLWVGTASGGLNFFDRENNIFISFRENDGLPNDTINGMLEDIKGHLWISTNKGLSKFDPEKRKFRNYDSTDGLQSNEFNPWACLKLKNGEFVFGGINGFNIFDPLDIKDNMNIPKVVITSFQIFNKKVRIAENNSPLNKSITTVDHLILSYKESVFSFEFAALDFNVPGKNQYAYMMDGFDKDWVYSGNRRFVTYTNLNPGEYIFRIKGSNNDGIWNEKGKALKIAITPPFWKTFWFKGLSALAIAGAAGGVYRNKLNQIRKEKTAQEEFTRKLLETQETDRKRISSELHDSIGHELLITKNKLLLTLKNPKNKDTILKDVNAVSEILSSTINDVREIAYNLHPYQLERLGLSKAIQSIIDRASKSTRISFISNIDLIDKILSSDVEISLYRIIQECVNNIVKHSQAEEVLVNLNKSRDHISILISDNGKGFNMGKVNESKDKYGFGLKGINERLKLFNGRMEIESTLGKGTAVKLFVPIRKGLITL